MQERNDEIEALQAIFSGEFRLEDNNLLEIQINLDIGREVKLRCHLPEEYPSVPAIPMIEAQWLTDSAREALHSQLENIALHDIGSVIVFKWVDWLRESSLDFLARSGHLEIQTTELQSEDVVEAPSGEMAQDTALNLPDWAREPVESLSSWSVFDQQCGMRCGVWGELDGNLSVQVNGDAAVIDTFRRGPSDSRSGACLLHGQPRSPWSLFGRAIPG